VGIARGRLGMLEGQWQREADQRTAKRQKQQRAAVNATPAAVRAALESQRSRILLQQRRDRGEISEGDYAAQDRKRLDDITAVRNKLISQYGSTYIGLFDVQLEVGTQRLARNPTSLEKPKPHPVTPVPTPAARRPPVVIP